MENREDEDDDEDLSRRLVVVSETGGGGGQLICLHVIECVISWAGGQRVLRPCVPADIGVHLRPVTYKMRPPYPSLCDLDND